jgi:hypothetical protein
MRTKLTHSRYMTADRKQLLPGTGDFSTRIAAYVWDDGSLRIDVGEYGFQVSVDFGEVDAHMFARQLNELLGIEYVDPVEEAAFYADSELVGNPKED